MNNRIKIKKILSVIAANAFLIFITFCISGCSYGIDSEKIPDIEAIDVTATDTTSGIGNPEKISINIASLMGPTTIGMIKIHEEKPPISENVSAYYDIIPNPEIMVAKILSGEIDIATLPTNVAAKLYNKGIEYKLAAITGYGVLYIVARDIQVKNWEDLKGERISITSKGSTPDIALRFLLEKNDLKPGLDIELDYSIEQVELSQMMIAGKSQLAILPEPFVTMVLDKNPDTYIAFDIEQEWRKFRDGQPMPMSCAVVKSELTDNNKEDIEYFLNMYKESIDWVNSNIEDASKLVEKYKIGMDAETAIQAIPRCNIRFTEAINAKGLVDDYLQTIMDFSPEDVGGKIPDENFYL